MTGPVVGSLFSGYGGLDLAVEEALGGTVAWHSEVDPGACRILAHRYPDVPNLGDVSAVDWATVQPVQVLTGGFPCQDVSAAGKRAGLAPHTRSGLWSEFHRAIVALRPSLVVIENVRGLLSAAAQHPAHGDVEPCPWCLGDDEPVALRALGAVLGDLADSGFDARWAGLRAADVGAPHGRFRVFVVAWPAADAERGGRDGRAGAPGQGRRLQPADRGDAPADTVGGELQRRRVGGVLGGPPTQEPRQGDQRQRAGREQDPQRGTLGRVPVTGTGRGNLDWGPYGAAVARWEHVLGRLAPAPTEPGAKGQPRLSPRFVEWLMGLPDGWVTDVPDLNRNQQLKALGNGVVPQQAAAAVRLLLGGVGE